MTTTQLKVMLEEMAGQISGVTKQREGSVEQYEYVGNVQGGEVGLMLDGRGRMINFLDDNNSYNFFLAIDSLVSPGPTFTNVNDFRALIITKS